MSVKLGGLQKTSLLDYEGKISAIVFLQGCNFRCGYCHNPELSSIQGASPIREEMFFEFLKTRQNKLDGVVITGGEPCLQNGLKDFIKQIKELGFLVKLDSNGSFPSVIENLLSENLLDYIAMDIKGPLDKYNKIIECMCDIKKIQTSIDIIKNSNIDYEFRTTVLKSQLNFNDFEKIGILINGAKKYFLQKFIPSKILNNSLIDEKTYTEEEFEEIKIILEKYIKNVYVR